MPILEYIWVLLVLLSVYLHQTWSEYAGAGSSKQLLHTLFYPDSYMLQKQKRPHEPTFSGQATRELPSQECCPSLTRGIAPLGGISKEGTLLQLYRDSNTVQKFYETTCTPGIVNTPCSFVDANRWVSGCQQKYTFTYAIVKDFNTTQPYRIDYMKMKSGCSCSVVGQVVRPVRPRVDTLGDALMEIEEELFGGV